MELSTGRAREKGNTFSVCNHVSGCVDITDLAQNVRQKRKSGQNVLFKAVKKAEYSPSRILFLVATVNCLATSKFPIGMGATMPGTITSYYQGLVGPEDYLGIADFCKAGILPLIVGVIYCLIFYKLIPNGTIDKSQVKDVKDAAPISKKDEYFIFGVFAAIMLGFMFTKQLGSDITNVIPAAGLLVLIVFKVLEIRK